MPKSSPRLLARSSAPRARSTRTPIHAAADADGRAMAMEAKTAGGAPYQSGEMIFNATCNVAVRSDPAMSTAITNAAIRTRRRRSPPGGWLPGAAHAIEAPKPQRRRPNKHQEAPPPEVTSRRRTSVHSTQKCSAFTAFRGLRGLKVPRRGASDTGTRRSRQSRRSPQQHRGAGQQRCEHCARARSALVRRRRPAARGDPEAAIAKWCRTIPTAARARVAGVIYAEAD